MPSILKADKTSWVDEDMDGDSTQQPMTIQKRVIQSGLDSIKGASATSIIELFKGLAVFAVRDHLHMQPQLIITLSQEDQILPVTILSVLWLSIDPVKNKLLSALKV